MGTKKRTTQAPSLYKCDKCQDKGYIEVEENGHIFVEICECTKVRQAEIEMARSGVNRSKTFENFITKEPFQRTMVKIADDYITKGYKEGKWLFAGGQVGCGKTHICTAVVNELMKQGVACKYMTWRDESIKLKANITDYSFEELVQPYKDVKVLYIDDFFKSQATPTPADVNLAFLILNYRYNDKNLLTVISSELYLADIVDLDEATGSRIVERTKGYRIEVARDKSRNYRLNS